MSFPYSQNTPNKSKAPLRLAASYPFIKPYMALIKWEFPGINSVMGTHRPADRDRFVQGVKELLRQTLAAPQTMNDLIRGTVKIPQD